MPTPPSSSDPSRRGRPARSGGRPPAGKGGGKSTGGKPAGGRSSGGKATGRGRSSARDRQSEGPPWKRRADARAGDDQRGKDAGWGGVARRGAGRLRDEGPGNASNAFREAARTQGSEWEPEVWVDEGEVREQAAGAVQRGRRRAATEPTEESIEPDPSLRRAVPPKAVDRMEQRVKEASRAFRRERYDEARKILRPIVEAAPTAETVRELLGLTYYRMGKWKLAVSELEAFRDLAGSTEQHPVLADCYRALGRHRKVAELWEDLRTASPSAALVAEGRIVYAGSLADQGQLADAISVLEASKPPARKPQEHHLRVTYALADLHERAGDVPRARQLFRIVASADPELGDVEHRLRALR